MSEETQAGSDIAPEDCLAASEFVDSEHPDVVAWARDRIGDAATDQEKASRLFLAVREELRYDPYAVSRDRSDYQASAILTQKNTFCVPKAVLLAAGARAVGIPARLGFADVKNHLSSDELREAMGTDLFVWHGYTELFIDGRWVKASPAFNESLCHFFGVEPLDFDGVHDALLQPYDHEGERCMEYVHHRGVFGDLPFEEIRDAFIATYGIDGF